MNCRMFKFFQGNVIAHSNVLVGHSLLKPFPSKIFILKNIHRSAFRRLGQSGYSRLGWSSSSRDGQVQIKYLYRQLFRRSKRDNKTRLDDSRLRQPMFRLLVPSMTRKISQVNRLGQSLPLIPNNRTRLRMSLLHSLLVCQALPLVFFHSCYPYKEKRC